MAHIYTNYEVLTHSKLSFHHHKKSHYSVAWFLQAVLWVSQGLQGKISSSSVLMCHSHICFSEVGREASHDDVSADDKMMSRFVHQLRSMDAIIEVQVKQI
jgi:hypothetical protein